jgi:formiminoglutamase
MTLPIDPRWPRAAHWLSAGQAAGANFVVLGVPAHETSISPTSAHTTPAAIRAALLRYSTHHLELDVDVRDLSIFDAGDVTSPDHEAGEVRVAEKVKSLSLSDALLCALGGDNSITYSVMSGLFGGELANAGLITFDAHYDLRDGISNGSPVKRLIDAGLNPKNIVQIGIADFSNSPEYAKRARELGITVISRSQLRKHDISNIVHHALHQLSECSAGIYVDFDVDVCDRSVVPACPAAAPGGISADELRQAARLVGEHLNVKAIDITEIDASIDAEDQRTVRLAALLVLEAAAGRLYTLRSR